MHKSLMPPNCRCIKNKCVFKIKHNGVNRVHLVACGYSQVPNVNFSKNYSPVVKNLTFCILLLMVLHFGYSAKIVDGETAFSTGTLKKKFVWSVLKACPTKKPLHDFFKQANLWPCSSSEAAL